MTLRKRVITFIAPRVGIEPTTKRLTVACSTTELPRNICLYCNLETTELIMTVKQSLG